MAAKLAERFGGVGDDFGDLVRRHDRSMRALAFRLLGDRDLMDDALQDAYAKALRSYGSFVGDSDRGTWLYRIVYNACIDVQRSIVRHRHDALDESLLPAVRNESPIDRWGGLAEALDALPVDQRAAVLLVDAEGFDYSEASEVLGIPIGTVASRLSRARAALRRNLEEDR